MKKILSMILIGVLCLTLTGCVFNFGNKTDKNEESKVESGEAKKETKKSDDVINDNDSYFILIDGKKFLAGDKISDLSSVGYDIKSTEADEEVPANKYMIGAGSMMNSEDKNIFSVTPFNNTVSTIKVSDSVIGGLDLSYVSAKHDERSADFEVYGGIKLGSTEEEVTEIFGEPSSVTDLDTSKTFTYSSDDAYRDYKFTIEDGKVSAIRWKNLVF